MTKSQSVRHSFILTVFTLQMIITLVSSQGGPCNPKRAKMSCLMGCLSCFESFGGDVYDTAACCADCILTQKDIIDIGPETCSEKYLRKSWLKSHGFDN